MTKAGMDIGSSLTKVVWEVEGKYCFRSTADKSIDEILEELKENQIKDLYISGIGTPDNELFNEFSVWKPKGDLIQNEIELQAEGSQKLLELGETPLEKYLLVSLGTGTSYTSINKNYVKKFPIGNSIGGGFIQGLSKLIGKEDFTNISKKAETGKSLDLLIQDNIPEKKGSFEGGLIISNFGKANQDSKLEDVYLGLINCVAITTIKDIYLMNMIPDYQIPKDIIFIGSTIANNPVMQNLFEHYSKLFLNKKAHFLENGEYSLALGAYHTTEKFEQIK